MSWGQHEAPFEACAARAAEHLAREEFHACDLPFHRAMTPGQRDPGFDRVIIIAASFGHTLEGAHRTLRGAGQPGLERLGVLLAHKRRQVPRPVDGLRNFGMLRAQLGAQLGFLLVTLRCTPSDQPSHLPCRQEWAAGLSDDGEG